MSRRSTFSSLSEYLRATGTTQVELAKQVGISQTQMSHYVRGNMEPRLAVALKLTAITGVPLEALAVSRHNSAA